MELYARKGDLQERQTCKKGLLSGKGDLRGRETRREGLLSGKGDLQEIAACWEAGYLFRRIDQERQVERNSNRQPVR